MVFTSTNPPSGYYVYAYIRADDLTPYYIGKGKGIRAWKKHGHTSVPKDQSKIIILEQNLTEIGAFAIERRLILWYGRVDDNTGILINRSSGGEGVSNPSEETRKKLSLANTGKIRTIENKKKLSEIAKNRTKSPRLGKKHSEESKIKMSLAKSNVSKETREKMSIARKKRITKKETLEKMSNTMKLKWLAKRADK